MAALVGFAFLIGGMLAVNRALQFLWRPFMGDDRVRHEERSLD